MSRAAAAALASTILLSCAGASPARADSVVLANRAQPGIESTVPQSPLELSVRGACVLARTLEEARGEPSLCPTGTWVAPGGDWSPTVHVAAGDRLELSFPTTQARVDVVGTSNYPVGLRTPDGTPVRNESLGAFATSPTANGSVWVATVPAPLDNRTLSPGFAAVAVTAREGDGRARNVAFRVQTPRSADESSRCGQAYYSASQSGYFCPDGGAPPGGGRLPPPGPASPPPPDPGSTPSPLPDLGSMPSAAAGRAVFRVVKPRIGAGCGILRWRGLSKVDGTAATQTASRRASGRSADAARAAGSCATPDPVNAPRAPTMGEQPTRHFGMGYSATAPRAARRRGCRRAPRLRCRRSAGGSRAGAR